MKKKIFLAVLCLALLTPSFKILYAEEPASVEISQEKDRTKALLLSSGTEEPKKRKRYILDSMGFVFHSAYWVSDKMATGLGVVTDGVVQGVQFGSNKLYQGCRYPFRRWLGSKTEESPS